MGFSLATFNVKNLLEPRGEDERVVVSQKLDVIAAVLRACDADVIGLQEVGPPELLRAVIQRMPSGYGEPVVGTPDSRGIRCALVSRVPVVSARIETATALSFPAFRVGDPPPFGTRIPLRRGVVHVQVEAPGVGAAHVFVVHFKSPLPVKMRDEGGAEIEPASPRARSEGTLRSLVWRAAEALHARSLVDDVLAATPTASVALVGDFNDRLESPVVRALRGDGDGELFDCTSGVAPAARFSVLHAGVPAHIDHVLVTANLLARVTSARFLNADLRDHGPVETGEPEPPTADSDHAPLVVRFE